MSPKPGGARQEGTPRPWSDLGSQGRDSEVVLSRSRILPRENECFPILTRAFLDLPLKRSWARQAHVAHDLGLTFLGPNASDHGLAITNGLGTTALECGPGIRQGRGLELIFGGCAKHHGVTQENTLVSAPFLPVVSQQ